MKGNTKLGNKSLHSVELNKDLLYNIEDTSLSVPKHIRENKIVRFARENTQDHLFTIFEKNQFGTFHGLFKRARSCWTRYFLLYIYIQSTSYRY